MKKTNSRLPLKKQRAPRLKLGSQQEKSRVARPQDLSLPTSPTPSPNSHLTAALRGVGAASESLPLLMEIIPLGVGATAFTFSQERIVFKVEIIRSMINTAH